MAFVVYLRDEIGNEINQFIEINKSFNMATLDILNGLLKKGKYYIPLEHILFIKEIS